MKSYQPEGLTHSNAVGSFALAYEADFQPAISNPNRPRAVPCRVYTSFHSFDFVEIPAFDRRLPVSRSRFGNDAAPEGRPEISPGCNPGNDTAEQSSPGRGERNRAIGYPRRKRMHDSMRKSSVAPAGAETGFAGSPRVVTRGYFLTPLRGWRSRHFEMCILGRALPWAGSPRSNQP